MNKFLIFAELLSEKKYFNKEEIANLIKIYFESWKQDEINEDKFINDRSKLISDRDELSLERTNIEFQLNIAKAKRNKKEYVDFEWMARAQYAFRIKKYQIVMIQNKLTELKHIQKAENIKNANDFDRKFRVKIFQLLTDKYSQEYAEELFIEAETLILANEKLH